MRAKTRLEFELVSSISISAPIIVTDLVYPISTLVLLSILSIQKSENNSEKYLFQRVSNKTL